MPVRLSSGVPETKSPRDIQVLTSALTNLKRPASCRGCLPGVSLSEFRVLPGHIPPAPSPLPTSIPLGPRCYRHPARNYEELRGPFHGDGRIPGMSGADAVCLIALGGCPVRSGTVGMEVR